MAGGWRFGCPHQQSVGDGLDTQLCLAVSSSLGSPQGMLEALQECPLHMGLGQYSLPVQSSDFPTRGNVYIVHYQPKVGHLEKTMSLKLIPVLVS